MHSKSNDGTSVMALKQLEDVIIDHSKTFAINEFVEGQKYSVI